MKMARSSRFLDYEVTWIRRRMYGLAFLDHVLVDCTSEDDPKLIEFIRMEITDLAEISMTDCHGNCCDSKSKIYALSYVAWMIRQMQCTKLWGILPKEKIMELAKEVLNVLAHDDAITGNALRIMSCRSVSTNQS